jgi:lipopolysaccharide export LptBFGC system permease protein LptF
MGVLLRWFGAFGLLSATFNPTQWNFYRWAEAHYSTQLPLTVLLGLLLAVAFIIYVAATLRSLGAFGMLLVAAVFAALIWVLEDWGILSTANSSLNIWLGILALSLVLGIGLSWSILWQKMSGQATVDEVDE